MAQIILGAMFLLPLLQGHHPDCGQYIRLVRDRASHDIPARVHAAEMVGRHHCITDGEIAQLLIIEPNSHVALELTFDLTRSRHSGPSVAALYSERLKDWQRERIAGALFRQRDAISVACLAKLARDPAPLVRRTAYESLSGCWMPSTQRILIARFHEEKNPRLHEYLDRLSGHGGTRKPVRVY